ncbi:glucose 1-dehydrogenase [Nocardioides sp. TF02-7]|uniref:SDR family NAD(P)-dependent oxidoreductase n=1 Tax=Nocardioides sp. TF02-7 TaxID=2917724 RepID=UPI001F06CF06|nr:glucose 1-dehydrogenase [Nocardioides sp. TF02-7]UMG91228.1 glucose 1-dehydrogenase [Nocardioides sp. TF02-7]
MSSSPEAVRTRVVVITAGGDGMGRAAALRFARSGAHVVVTDLDDGRADAVAAEVVAAGATAEAHRLDVSDVDAVERLVDTVGRAHGRINVLYNNAGVPGPSGTDIARADFDRLLAVNLEGGLRACSAAEPWLAAGAPDASVVFTSSVAGLVGSPLSPLYSASKGAVVSLTKSLALALAPQGIRVNAVCPGPVDTAMLPRFVSRDDDVSPTDRRAMLVGSVPLGRLASPSEVAAAVHFLASDEASYITGVALPVDGGYTAR